MGINNITGSNFKHAKSNCFPSSLLKLIIRIGFSATSYLYEYDNMKDMKVCLETTVFTKVGRLEMKLKELLHELVLLCFKINH